VSRKVEGVPASFLNKKIGETVSLSEIGLDGYEARITGGSDKEGFPMHPSVVGAMRRKILSLAGTGFRQGEKGEKRRKSVRGNTVSDLTAQLNVAVVKEGKPSFKELVEQTPKGIEQKKSVREEMVEKSLAGVGDESVAAMAKEIKKSKK
jgi:small subunit ribosomal protein S6e